MEKIKKEVAERAEKIQAEMQETINGTIDPKTYKKGSYQDYVTVLLITKIAELQIELENLK